MSMSPSLILSDGNQVGLMRTPLSCNGFQIFWEVVDKITHAPADPTGTILLFNVELPDGTLIPFDANPVKASDFTIDATSSSGGLPIKVSAVNVGVNSLIRVYLFGLF